MKIPPLFPCGVAAIMLALASLAACGHQTVDVGGKIMNAEDAGPRLSLGAVLSLTGSSAKLGQQALEGAELAVQQINALGGVDGVMLDLVVADDASDPVQSAAKASELLANGIALGIGPTTHEDVAGFYALAAAPQAPRQDAAATTALPGRVLYVSPSAMLPPAAVEQPAAVLRLVPKATLLATALVVYASSGNPRLCTRLTVVYQHDALGNTLADATASRYEQLNLLVVRRIPLDAWTTAPLAAAAALATTPGSTGSMEPDCQIVIAQPGRAAAYLDAFKAYVQSHAADRDWSFFKTVGTDLLCESPVGFDACLTFRLDDQESVENGTFRTAFVAKHGHPPGRYAATGYDAVMLFATGYARVGTRDIPQLLPGILAVSSGAEPLGPSGLSHLLGAASRGESVHYIGASGEGDFTSTGEVIGAVGVWDTSGKLVQSYPGAWLADMTQ